MRLDRDRVMRMVRSLLSPVSANLTELNILIVLRYLDDLTIIICGVPLSGALPFPLRGHTVMEEVYFR